MTVVVGRVFGDVTGELRDLYVALQVAFEAGEQNLPLSGLQSVHLSQMSAKKWLHEIKKKKKDEDNSGTMQGMERTQSASEKRMNSLLMNSLYESFLLVWST